MREEVEAVLLHSEGDPEEEVGEALYAVVKFAMLECGYTRTGLEDLFQKTVHQVIAQERS